MTYDTRTDRGWAHLTDYGFGDDDNWLTAEIERSKLSTDWVGLTLGGPDGEVTINGHAAIKSIRDLCDRALKEREGV